MVGRGLTCCCQSSTNNNGNIGSGLRRASHTLNVEEMLRLEIVPVDDDRSGGRPGAVERASTVELQIVGQAQHGPHDRGQVIVRAGRSGGHGDEADDTFVGSWQ